MTLERVASRGGEEPDGCGYMDMLPKGTPRAGNVEVGGHRAGGRSLFWAGGRVPGSMRRAGV